ncbi:MAG: energy transducer TonB [Bdellovibrionales bacterium]
MNKFLTIVNISVFLSFMFHLGVFKLVMWTGQEEPKLVKDNMIEFTTIPSKTKEEQQIVEQDEKARNDEVPEEEYFLSKNNQTIKDQTKAKLTGKFNNKQQLAGIDKNKKQKNKTKLQKIKNLLPGYKMSPENETNGSAQMAELAKSSDHLKDINEGAQTMLNTREFVYYTYYSRIKKQLQQFWEPAIKDRMHKIMRSGRQPASIKTRVTKLLIILDDGGTLVGVQVVGASGVFDLDETAIEAFKQAAPFPNPPKGIVENDGTVKIRWDFVLEA